MSLPVGNLIQPARSKSVELTLRRNTVLTIKFSDGRRLRSEAAIAQLGERQTEDLEVPGSIPGFGIILFSCWRHAKGIAFRS